ncbi:MAG: hypothetical protein ACPL7B_04280 [Candidatus Poribacteria bacterium]
MQENIANTWITNRRKDIANGTWAKCPECNELIYNRELDRNLHICKRCNYYFPMDPPTRISFIADEGRFISYDNSNKDKDIIISGEAKISGYQVAIIVFNLNLSLNMDSFLLTEKIVNTINKAVEQRLPLLAIYTIGNKRHFANIPIQLLNVTTAISKLNKASLPYISLLSQASADSNFPAFAYSADIVIAESNLPGTSHTGSRIGRRDAERAMQALFQSGIVDMIVPREDLKIKITDILKFFY